MNENKQTNSLKILMGFDEFSWKNLLWSNSFGNCFKIFNFSIGIAFFGIFCIITHVDYNDVDLFTSIIGSKSA